MMVCYDSSAKKGAEDALSALKSALAAENAEQIKAAMEGAKTALTNLGDSIYKGASSSSSSGKDGNKEQ